MLHVVSELVPGVRPFLTYDDAVLQADALAHILLHVGAATLGELTVERIATFR